MTFGGTAYALMQCSDIGIGLQRCQVGIDSTLIGKVADRQHASEWCWAASISMVFAYYKHPVSQERIVKETWTQIVNLPGQPGQIVADLNRSWIDDSGKTFTAKGDVFSANIVTAAQDLRDNDPLLIGALGHCMVLTALTYDVNAIGQFKILGATVRDPWPSNPGQRQLTPLEWSKVQFLARVRVSDTALPDADKDVGNHKNSGYRKAKLPDEDDSDNAKKNGGYRKIIFPDEDD
jgi:hypothetical protein